MTAWAESPRPNRPDADSVVINDSWYTMQAGSTPWGYFHEKIELRDGRYSYRYDMTKRERGVIYRENIGAIAQADLTPVAFNLNKSGVGATETINATYSRDKQSGIFAIEVRGSKAATFKRRVTPATILDVFFPIWLKQNWSKVTKPNSKGWVHTFAEDPEKGEFRPKMVRYTSKGNDPKDGCLVLDVLIETASARWCMTPEGVLVDLVMGSYHVRKARSEDEAKAFLGIQE